MIPIYSNMNSMYENEANNTYIATPQIWAQKVNSEMNLRPTKAKYELYQKITLPQTQGVQIWNFIKNRVEIDLEIISLSNFNFTKEFPNFKL